MGLIPVGGAVGRRFAVCMRDNSHEERAWAMQGRTHTDPQPPIWCCGQVHSLPFFTWECSSCKLSPSKAPAPSCISMPDA